MQMDAYTDDATIADEAILLRRIPPRHLVYDENLMRWRPSSAAFENHPDGSPMSVLLADVLRTSGRNAADALRGHEGFALAAITAGLARAHHQDVAREPLPDEPAHAVVVGIKTQAIRRKLAKQATWAVPPPPEVEA